MKNMHITARPDDRGTNINGVPGLDGMNACVHIAGLIKTQADGVTGREHGIPYTAESLIAATALEFHADRIAA
jgi:hypothetical protein